MASEVVRTRSNITAPCAPLLPAVIENRGGGSSGPRRRKLSMRITLEYTIDERRETRFNARTKASAGIFPPRHSEEW